MDWTGWWFPRNRRGTEEEEMKARTAALLLATALFAWPGASFADDAPASPPASSAGKTDAPASEPGAAKTGAAAPPSTVGKAKTAVKDGARAVGHATRDATRAIGHGTRDMVHGIGDAASNAWHDVTK
jgi:hypothetical protein